MKFSMGTLFNQYRCPQFLLVGGFNNQSIGMIRERIMDTTVQKINSWGYRICIFLINMGPLSSCTQHLNQYLSTSKSHGSGWVRYSHPAPKLISRNAHGYPADTPNCRTLFIEINAIIIFILVVAIEIVIVIFGVPIYIDDFVNGFL